MFRCTHLRRHFAARRLFRRNNDLSVQIGMRRRIDGEIGEIGGDGRGQARRDMSFISKVKAAGANALLGGFIINEGRFDGCMKGLKVVEVGKGNVTAHLRVEKALENAYSTLHGGAICTIVDVVGTMAILSLDPTKPGVSIDLNVSFVAAAKADEEVVIKGDVLKMGKKLGFTEVRVESKEDGRLIATGRHTKAFR